MNSSLAFCRPAPRGFGRCFDLCCSVLSLLFLSPLLLAIAGIVLLFDGRPVLFRQQRMGLGGKPFQILKFRTMTPRQPGSEASLITAAGDPRITKLGRWLRRFKLDELPQIFNVLRGEMSIVGPRPEVGKYVRLTEPRWQGVLQVRPGITDWATLAYVDEEQTLAGCADPERNYRETILPRKLDMNLKYLRVRTRRSDVKLILLTLSRIARVGRSDCRWMGDSPFSGEAT